MFISWRPLHYNMDPQLGLDIVYDALAENENISSTDKLVLGEYILSAIQHCAPKDEKTTFGVAMKAISLSIGWETYCGLWIGTRILFFTSLLVNVYLFGRLRRMKVYRISTSTGRRVLIHFETEIEVWKKFFILLLNIEIVLSIFYLWETIVRIFRVLCTFCTWIDSLTLRLFYFPKCRRDIALGIQAIYSGFGGGGNIVMWLKK